MILAALTANHVLYEDEACPTFVVQKIAFWWSNYLKERDLNLYDQGLATASQLTANGTFQPRKLVHASASACQRDAAKTSKPPSHLRGKQVAAWKAENDPDSLEAKLNPTGAASSTATYRVAAPPPPPPPAVPLSDAQPVPPPGPPSPEAMDVDQDNAPASSAAIAADTVKQEEKVEPSELSDKEKGKEDEKMEESGLPDKDKDKADESDSDVSSIGDDLPAQAEDQDSAEEADVAQRLIKHRSVNPGQEEVLCQDETGKTVTITAGEAATARPVSKLSDEGNESEELIEDDPTVDPSVPRTWKGKQHPPEPVLPDSPKETKYRPVRQKRQNKIPTKGKKKAYFECPEEDTACSNCGEVTDLYCRKCGDTTCSECRNTDLNINCGCHNSHICQVDGDSRPICLRPEQEEALQLYAGISDAQAKEYARATKVWRQWARNHMKKIKMPRYLKEARRSYTSKNSALTEQEFWVHNCREDQSRKDRANILPAEVYKLDKRWKPDDVLASVSKLLGIQLSGPQKHKRESMSLHLRDDPKLTLAIFDFGSLNKEPVCPHDNSRLPRQYAIPPRMIAHNAANIIVVFNSQDGR